MSPDPQTSAKGTSVNPAGVLRAGVHPPGRAAYDLPVMARGNDPSLPRELVWGNALEVVYEGCTVGPGVPAQQLLGVPLTPTPVSNSTSCPWVAAWRRANRYSAVIASSSTEACR